MTSVVGETRIEEEEIVMLLGMIHDICGGGDED